MHDSSFSFGQHRTLQGCLQVLGPLWKLSDSDHFFQNFFELYRTLLTIFKSPNRRESGSLVGGHSLFSVHSPSPGRLQADREQVDAKSKDRRQVRLPGQRRGDVVRGRRLVGYQDFGPEKSAEGCA